MTDKILPCIYSFLYVYLYTYTAGLFIPPEIGHRYRLSVIRKPDELQPEFL